MIESRFNIVLLLREDIRLQRMSQGAISCTKDLVLSLKMSWVYHSEAI